MKTSCIHHPENNTFLIIRSWQLAFCDGNHCAAALLSIFEYWHNIKLRMQIKNRHSNEIALQHGDNRSQDESLFQFHNLEDLQESIQYLYSTNTIQNAIDFLVQKGVVSIHANPNPKYRFDKTRYFLFRPEILNHWLKTEQNLTYTPRKKTKTSSGGSTPCVSSVQTGQEEPRSPDEGQIFSESSEEYYRSTSINFDRSKSQFSNPDLSNLTDRSINFDRRSIKIDKAITHDDLQRNKEEERNYLEGPHTFHRTSSASHVLMANEKDPVQAYPSALASLPTLQQNDHDIRDTLTQTQHAWVKEYASQLQSMFPAFSAQDLMAHLESELLDPHSYKKCHQGFLLKLNTIRSAALKQTWFGSERLYRCQKEAEHQEQDALTERKRQLRVEIQHATAEVQQLQQDAKLHAHYAKGTNGFQPLLESWEMKLSKLYQQLQALEKSEAPQALGLSNATPFPFHSSTSEGSLR